MSERSLKAVMAFAALSILLFSTVGIVYSLTGPTGTEGAIFGGSVEEDADAASNSFRFWFFNMTIVPWLVLFGAFWAFLKKKGFL